MSRRLLLIGNPGEQGVNYSPSVSIVLNRYKNFFRSEAGGYWCDDEIIEEPLGLDRNSEVTWFVLTMRELNLSVGYSVIVFVGHGGSYFGKDQVQLSLGEILPLSCLMAPNGMEDRVKRLIIVDACRSLIGVQSDQLLLESKSFSGNGQLMGDYCREYYNSLIEKCEPHVELLQSTQYGEVANINPNHTGTAFSDALFDIIDNCIPQWNSDALGNRNGQSTKSIIELLPAIKVNMTAYNQVPEFTRVGGNGDFPIYAVWRAVDRVF